MKIALASAKFKNNDVPFNLRQIEDCMLQAKEAGAELVCFGEAFLQGFDALTWYWERDRDVAVTTDSEVFRALERLTADTGIDLLVGFLEREGEEIYSSCALLSEGRAVHNYRRISRGWKDFRKTDAHYREGREVALTMERYYERGRRNGRIPCGEAGTDLPGQRICRRSRRVEPGAQRGQQRTDGAPAPEPA